MSSWDPQWFRPGPHRIKHNPPIRYPNEHSDTRFNWKRSPAYTKPWSRSRSPRHKVHNLPLQSGPGYAAGELNTDLEPISRANKMEPKSREMPPQQWMMLDRTLNANLANGGNNVGDIAHFEPPPQPPPRNRQVRNQNATRSSDSTTFPIRNQNQESHEGSPEVMSLPEVISNAMELTTRV